MKKRLTIGAVIGNSNSPHMRDVMRGIENAAEKYDCNTMYFLGVHMAPSFYAHFEDEFKYDYDYQYNVVYDYALLSGCDVLIISYGTISMFLENANHKEFLEKFASIPYVLLLDRDESGKGSSLMSNNYDGMYRVVEHLVLVHRYKKLAFMGGPNGNTDAIERKKAFTDVLDSYHIPYSDKNFAVGDYTIHVERQIHQLLNDNPGLEALVCANDLMADTAYKICADRGLVVGKDIAITGYDDWEMAVRMNPPLTTVTQSGFDTGFSAVEEAISLYETKEPAEHFVPTAVKIRSSCGCGSHETGHVFSFYELEGIQKETYVAGIVRSLVNKSLISTANEAIRDSVVALISPLVDEIFNLLQEPEKLLSGESLVSYLTAIYNSVLIEYLSPVLLTDAIENLIMDRIKHEKDLTRIKAYAVVLSTVQKFTRSTISKNNGDEMTKYQSDTMFMPYISLEMMSHIEDVKDFYQSTMSMLSSMGVKSTYVYMMEHSVKHTRDEEWQVPDQLKLMACHRGNNILSYDFEEAPILEAGHPLTAFMKREKRYTVSVFDVFMGENQYGILVTETDPKNMLLMNLACLQVSSAINFRRLFVRQQELGKELESVVSQLEEKNRILGFLSEYDQLTGCLNRRGFAEKVEMLFHKNVGANAIMVLADLDHLKEINDIFGHTEGDFAIKSVATILQSALGMDSIISRMGGDEFCAIYIPHNEHFSGEETKMMIESLNDSFLENCDKPYYIELSIGCHEFEIQKDLDIQELMKEADLLLYQDKNSRRESIQRLFLTIENDAFSED